MSSGLRHLDAEGTLLMRTAISICQAAEYEKWLAALQPMGSAYHPMSFDSGQPSELQAEQEIE